MARQGPGDRAPADARRWRRVLPVVAVGLVLLLLGSAALRVGAANLASAKEARLAYRKTVVEGVVRVIDAATPTTDLIRLSSLRPDHPVVDEALVNRFRDVLGADAVTEAVLLARDGTVLSSAPASHPLEVSSLGESWTTALHGTVALSDVFSWDGAVMNALVYPVGDGEPWAVLAVVQRAELPAMQKYFNNLGSLGSGPGGLLAVDQQGVAAKAWNPSLLGQKVMSPAQVAAFPYGVATDVVTSGANGDVINIGARERVGYAVVFQQDATGLFGDLDAAQHQRDLTIIGVLGGALIAMALFQWTRERAANRDERRLRSLVHSSQDLVVVVDRGAHLRFISPAIEPLLDQSLSHWNGRAVTGLCHPDDASRLLGLIEDPASGPDLNIRLRTRAGGYRWFDVDAESLAGERDIEGVLLTAHEVGNRKALEDELASLAVHDRLTGLANRAQLTDRLEQLHPHGCPTTRLALLYIDLDNFKPVNDRLGHEAGDRVLTVVAERLRSTVPAPNLACRLGGDEFAVLLEGADEDSARQVAQTIATAVRKPIEWNFERVNVDSSIGIASVDPSSASSSGELLRRADQAMYGAKHAGRGCIQVAPHSGGPGPDTSTAPTRSATGIGGPGTEDAPDAGHLPARDLARPAPRRGSRLSAWAPLLAAALVVGSTGAIGAAQSTTWQRDAETGRLHESVEFIRHLGSYYGTIFDASKMRSNGTAAPWALDGGALDHAILKAFTESPLAGRGARAVLATADGATIAAWPTDARLNIPAHGQAWAAAVDGHVGVEPLIHDPDDVRTYILMPVVRDGRTVAVVAEGISGTQGTFQQRLADTTPAGHHFGTASIVDASGQATASANPGLVGQVLADPTALAGLAPGEATILSKTDDEVVIATPLVGREPTAPLYLLHTLPLGDAYADIRAVTAQGQAALLGLVLASVLGLAFFNHSRERAVRRHERRLDALLRNSHDVIVVVNDQRVVFTSPTTAGVLGFDPCTSGIGRLLDAVHPDDQRRVTEVFTDLRPGHPSRLGDVRVHTSAGLHQWFDIDIVDLRHDRAVGGVLLTCHDVTARRTLQDQLADQARRDPLTGLPNRAALGTDLARLSDEGRLDTFAVLFIDLDRFKPVNDTLGHDAGDEVLRIVADRYRQAVRRGSGSTRHDEVYRWGGDEFALLLGNVNDSEAKAIAERILETTRAPIAVAGTMATLGATIGIAVASERCHEPDALVAAADSAMYRAKEAGRDRYAVFAAGSD